MSVSIWPHPPRVVRSSADLSPLSDYFDVLDSKHRPVLTEHDIIKNLEAIIADADKIPEIEVRSPPSDDFYRN